MFEEDNAQWGLVHALVLDGKGGARAIARTELDDLQLQAHESLWLHWDRSHPQTQTWLRKSSGLSEFSCDLLLEENTRPRLLALPDSEFLLFLRGINLNPGAEPEDMVSVRIFGSAQRVISCACGHCARRMSCWCNWAKARDRKPPPNSSFIWLST